MSSWRFSSVWSRFFGFTPAQPARSVPPLPKRPAPQAARIVSREALEIEWLLRCLPPSVQMGLRPALLALKRARPYSGALPVDDYTWPDMPGVWRPPYSAAVLKMKTLEGLRARLHDDLSLGVAALYAPEPVLPRPMRNALLAMQGRRLGQVSEALARWLRPEEALLVFQQELY
ncbi:MAG TPA: hypothetical protein VH599_16815 [Ktedonobacterales bacterium]|jgi:hypothetical protein